MEITSKRKRSGDVFLRTAIAAAAASIVASGVVWAQDEAPAAASEPTKLDTIEVTGSRIRSFTADSPSPIQVLTAQDIERSGVTNIQELLVKIPMMGTPALSRTNSNFLTASAGVATIDLRDLGTDRTLVLVNGRRFVSGLPGSAAVDLNTIPTDFIDRVEIYTGGASAIYGSDAMAGVVNIILKRNFQGLLLDMQKGQSAEGDDKKDKISLTTGVSSADGRSNLMGHFAYSKQGVVRAKDRSGNEIDNLPRAFLTGDPGDMFEFVTPFLSSFAPQGRIFFEGGSRTFDRNGNIIPVDTNGTNTGNPTGFNRQDFRTLAVPTERYLFATSGELAFSDNHSAFFEGTYAQTQTRTQLEPFPMDSADFFTGLYPGGINGGRGPAEFNVNGQILANPLIPADLLALMTDSDGDGLRDYSFSRRLSEVGNRGNAADRDTFRVLTGIKGAVLDSWNYEVFAAYGSTKEAQVSGGQVNVLNFRNAMEAIPDVDDVDGDGDTGEAICRDPFARAQGCVPADIFGFNTLTPEMLGYISAPSFLATFTEQQLVGGTLTGDLFQLPAGPLGVAIGGEYRDEFSRSEFDALQQAGLNAGNKIPPTQGGFHVTEAFVEVRAPIVKDLPGAQMVALSGALRVGDYSTVGNVLSYTAALDWSPVQDLRVRATTARSTRAPNISELFQPPTQDFPQVNDPCEGVTLADTGTLAERCRAAPGVLENMNANGGEFTLNQADIQGTSGFDRGNPGLDEEVGDSWTAGVVWQPTGIDFLRNASFEIDFYRIEIEDAILAPSEQIILDQCYTGDTSFCQFVTRRPTALGANSAGSLLLVDQEFANSGGLVAKGYDLTINWSGQVGPGQLVSRLIYARLFDAYERPLPFADKDRYAGEVGSAKDKASLQLGYGWGPWALQTLTTYIGKSALDDQFLASFGADPGSITVSEKIYFDLQASYTWQTATFYVGADNLFDTSAPRFDTNALISGATTGAGTAADVYDAIGPRYYAGVRLSL